MENPHSHVKAGTSGVEAQVVLVTVTSSRREFSRAKVILTLDVA